ELADLKVNPALPPAIALETEALASALEHPLCQQFLKMEASIGHRALLMLGFRARRELKATVYKMMMHYARLDAMRALGVSGLRNGWVLPGIEESDAILFDAEGLYHPLLSRPVPYDIGFGASHNF